jgi:hypothetical protein
MLRSVDGVNDDAKTAALAQLSIWAVVSLVVSNLRILEDFEHLVFADPSLGRAHPQMGRQVPAWGFSFVGP